jgi:CheY-like chemotaxis protein
MATILLVEDNDDLRDTIRLRLEADQHRVVEAADGNEAIRSWSEHKPDLIITDFNMPRMNGLEVIKAVAAHQPALPIILMSGGIEEQVRLCILYQFPSVRYLPKDVLCSQLRQSVREALT